MAFGPKRHRKRPVRRHSCPFVAAMRSDSAVLHSTGSGWIGVLDRRAGHRRGRLLRTHARAVPITEVPPPQPRPDDAPSRARYARRAAARPCRLATRPPARRGVHPRDCRLALRLVAAPVCLSTSRRSRQPRPPRGPVVPASSAPGSTRSPSRSTALTSPSTIQRRYFSGQPATSPSSIWSSPWMRRWLVATSRSTSCARWPSRGVQGRADSALRCELCDGRSESAWESLLRVFHHVAEIDVEPQVVILDPTGAFVARADLVVEATGDLHEYDGRGHDDPRQRALDLRRLRRLHEVGRVRRGFTAADLVVRASVTMHELDRALGRPHDPRRTQRWLTLLKESCLTAAGRDRLQNRWLATRHWSQTPA